MKKLIALLTLLTPFYLWAQTLAPEDALEKFSKYPQERIFVQFDKGDYLAGENMHFKAYVFSGLKLSRISTNLYVECLDHNKQTIYKNIFPIASGLAEGSYLLPKNLPENVYYFRAYTSWMLNFADKFQFIQPLNIYNPSSPTKLIEQPIAWEATVHPEGGQLLDNTECAVAVRLHAAGQLPQHWTGYVFENNDSTKKLTEFSSLNEEVSSFILIPDYRKLYSVKITDDHHHSKIISLPAVAQQGISLRTANLFNGIGYRLTARGLSGHLQGYKILAQLQGEVVYNALVKNEKEEINGNILIDSLTKGLLHITVFDAKGNVAAERLCFANPKTAATLSPQVEFTKMSSKQRGLNEWSVNVDSINPDTYTVEVLNANTPVTGDSRSLLNAFWLGDLSTPPYNNAYFSDETSGNALDALLMSEKWERFQWSKIQSNPVPVIKYFPDNFLAYQGSVVRNKKPVLNQNVNILFQMKDSSKIFMQVRTDSVGNFRMKNLVFRDTAKVYFQVNSNKNSATHIDINFTRLDNFTPWTNNLPVALYTTTSRGENDTVPQRVKEYSATLRSIENQDERYKTMQAVEVKALKKDVTEELNKKLSTGMFQDINEKVFDFVHEDQDAMGFSNILDWLQGRVAGLQIEMRDGNLVPVIRGSVAKIYQDEFLIDPSMVSSIPVSEIAMVKVLKNGFLTGGSAIAIYTLRAGMTSKYEVPSLPSNTLVGYPQVEKFKVQEYADDNFNLPRKDTRSILYWNTTLNPQKDKATIQFYNNDISKKLRMIVVGFSSTGLPVYLNKEIAL